jgi:hypothetical protein
MTEYAFLTTTEPATAKRSRQLRVVVAFCVTLAVSMGVGFLWRRYHPGDSNSLFDNAVDGLIATGVGIMQGEGTKASAEKLRREFKLRIDGDTITRERKPLTLYRREIKAVYVGPYASLWITSNDSRRKIVVPGELEERDQLLRELAGMGIPLRFFTDWLVDIALVRAFLAALVAIASIALWFPGPVWRLAIATTVLLGACGWYSIRVGDDPNVEHVGLERFVIALVAIGILWRDAHLLFGVWP